MGIILRVKGATEIRKDTKALIACLLLREVMTGIWVDKITKGDSAHKAGTYQIVRPTRGNKQKVVNAVETIVNGCSGLERKIAYMEINSIWNSKKCFEEIKSLEAHISQINKDHFAELNELKSKATVCVDLIDGLSEKKGLVKYIKLIIATVKFGKCAKKFVKIVKDIFKTSELHVNMELTYNLKVNAVEMEVTTHNEVVDVLTVNKSPEYV